MTAARRLAAILAADVVGYLRLMGEDEAGTAEARRLNPAITIKWLKEHTPNLPVSFDGLRKAGLPEE